MEEVFRTRRIKIKLISFDVGNVDIIVENKRRLLYYQIIKLPMNFGNHLTTY